MTNRRENRNRDASAPIIGFNNALLLTGDQKYVDAWRTHDQRGQRQRAHGQRQEAVSDDVGLDLPQPRRPGRLVRLAGPAVERRRAGGVVLLAEAGRSGARERQSVGRVSAGAESRAIQRRRWPTDLATITRRVEGIRKDQSKPDKRLADNMLDLNPVATTR